MQLLQLVHGSICTVGLGEREKKKGERGEGQETIKEIQIGNQGKEGKARESRESKRKGGEEVRGRKE